MFDAKKTTDQLIGWIKDYFKDIPTAKAVVGISGGKDSSIVAALCVKALGSHRVFGVLMPQGSQQDIDVSYQLCQYLGINYVEINVKTPIDEMFVALKNANIALNTVATFNTPARIRMATLYAVAGSIGGRVANTCNLSEDWVGYSTKFGDAAGDFSPLSNLTVTEVKAVGKELGLSTIFTEKIPIDGLCGKTDEDNLGFTYATLDKYIREGLCPDSATKEKIDKMHVNNLHKLQLMPSFPYTPQ